MNSRDLLKQLLEAGWVATRIRGSHHILRHPSRAGHISLPHPRKDLSAGLVHKLRRQAGLE
ncbi:MAG TPA: type II toxin-antitoxin system HicA family toxin [Quisquiliibacterium sp.]|nr:type II toxin-antitoxin system HicA family toxin [Quisquiliibacterium sp.]